MCSNSVGKPRVTCVQFESPAPQIAERNIGILRCGCVMIVTLKISPRLSRCVKKDTLFVVSLSR